jgi:hypothetical protein
MRSGTKSICTLPPVDAGMKPVDSGVVAFDSTQLVLFAGYDCNKRLNDTWGFDGTQWKPLVPTARTRK